MVVTLTRPYIETTHVNPRVTHRVVRGSGMALEKMEKLGSIFTDD